MMVLLWVALLEVACASGVPPDPRGTGQEGEGDDGSLVQIAPAARRPRWIEGPGASEALDIETLMAQAASKTQELSEEPGLLQVSEPLGVCPPMTHGPSVVGTTFTWMVSGQECVTMGGRPMGDTSGWFPCGLRWCRASQALWFPSRPGSCPGANRGGYGAIDAQAGNCRTSLNGGINGIPLAETWTGCHVDFCKKNTGEKTHALAASSASCGFLASVRVFRFLCAGMGGWCNHGADLFPGDNLLCDCHLKMCPNVVNYTRDCAGGGKIEGHWRFQKLLNYDTTIENTEYSSVETGTDKLTSEDFTTGVGTEISMTKEVGLSKGIATVGASTTVTLSAHASTSIVNEITQTRRAITSTENRQSFIIPAGALWSFELRVPNRCGTGRIQLGGTLNSLVVTANRDAFPCCLPGNFKDVRTPHGECVASAPEAECIELCGKSVCDHFHRLTCPALFQQVGGLGTDIHGCGLEECSQRKEYNDIQFCADRCADRMDCLAFNWAPPSAPEFARICTLYGKNDMAKSLGTWPNGQIFCKKKPPPTPSPQPR